MVRGLLRCEGGIAGKTLAIDGLDSTITDVIVRVHPRNGQLESHLLKPTAPSVTLGAATSTWDRSRTYVRLGIEHILLGVDHLLFVLGLVILIGSARPLLWTITAFTIAHSLTLAAATFGWISVSPPPVEAVIALSIVFVASEIVQSRRGRPSLSARKPWLVAFAFGLLHGFGFAGALSEIGFPAQQIPLALLCFNLGVEAGQLAFVAALLLLGRLPALLRIEAPRGWPTAAAYGIGALASYWLIERLLAF